jgi:hypothetical protein
MRTFKYRGYTVRYSKKGFMWSNREWERVPYAVSLYCGIEVYFESKHTAKQAIDEYEG